MQARCGQIGAERQPTPESCAGCFGTTRRGRVAAGGQLPAATRPSSFVPHQRYYDTDTVTVRVESDRQALRGPAFNRRPERVFNGQRLNPLTVLQILAVEADAAGLDGTGDDHRVVEAEPVPVT